jgi:hypothetical protein
MLNVPAIRAGWPKLAMSVVKTLASPQREAILERLGERRAKIREASFRDYVALEHFVFLADTALDVLGLLPARTLWRNVMLAALQQPAIGELVRRAGAINQDPTPLLKRTADAFRFVHDQCGDWIVKAEPAARKVVILLENAPALTLESGGMHAVYWGNVSAAFASVDVDAKISVTAEPAEMRIRYRAHW